MDNKEGAVSPLEIEILLWYFCRAEDHKDARNPPPPQEAAFSRFVKDGYLRDNCADGKPLIEVMRYEPTEKLHVYCEALCRVPEPRQEWVCG